jgi:hypothetical protein
MQPEQTLIYTPAAVFSVEARCLNPLLYCLLLTASAVEQFRHAYARVLGSEEPPLPPLQLCGV